MIKQLVANTEKQHRALKLRIYPNPEQTILINKTFGCCRQIYNNRLFERNEFYQKVIKQEPDKNKQKELWKSAHFSSEKEMKEKFPYLAEVSAQALCSATMFAETAYKNFFQSLKGQRAGSKVSVNSSLNYSTHSPRILKGVSSMFQGSRFFQSSSVWA